MTKYEELLNFFNENNISLDYNQVQQLYSIADSQAIHEGLIQFLKDKFLHKKKPHVTPVHHSRGNHSVEHIQKKEIQKQENQPEEVSISVSTSQENNEKPVVQKSSSVSYGNKKFFDVIEAQYPNTVESIRKVLQGVIDSFPRIQSAAERDGLNDYCNYMIDGSSTPDDLIELSYVYDPSSDYDWPFEDIFKAKFDNVVQGGKVKVATSIILFDLASYVKDNDLGDVKSLDFWNTKYSQVEKTILSSLNSAVSGSNFEVSGGGDYDSLDLVVEFSVAIR